ncbi:MAG: hypothetical protein PHT26_15920, partial [Lentimicrobiaceae bacterium]|nr:hypothetical protein [Lentimicrobiaceae bacterium]
FNNPKILWCKETAPELGRKIQSDLSSEKMDLKVSVAAFILSTTSHSDLATRWGEGTGTTKETFAQNNVLFIEDDKAYLWKVFENLGEK